MTTETSGEIWSYCIELIRALQPLQIDVTLACMGPPPQTRHYDSLAALTDVELITRECRLEWMMNCEEDLARAGDWLLELEQRKRPDLIHLNGYAHGALPWQSPALLVAHSCMVSRWRAVYGCEPPATWDGYRRRVRAGLEGVRAVVAPTAWMLAQLLGRYDVHFDGLVINHGRRSSEYRASPKHALVLGAGCLRDPAKNFQALDAAADQLPWPVVVAEQPGDTEDPRALTRNVTLLGAPASGELAGWMSHAAIFAHPARYEPFGLAPLEAALSGCALVLGDIGSLRELWGDAAQFVDPDDHQALAATLRELIEDPVRRSIMAARAQARAQHYSVTRMSTAYQGLYLELARANMVTARAS